MSSQGITETLVSEVRKLSAAELPDKVLVAARHSALDWLAVSLAGAREPLVEPLLAAVREQGGRPHATVLWHGERTSPAFAALVNGSMSDALDFADSNPNMRGHSTPAVVATALALAESRRASGREFLAGIVAGVEAECRVGLLVNRGLKPGWHPTGNIAPFGAAACAAYFRGLDADKWVQALAIVATQAAGLHNSGGTMSKPFHSGKAAMNGILSASLAENGFTGRADAIEASEGFLSTRADDPDAESLHASAGRYLILDTTFKSHAACGLTHDTIDNVLHLKREHRLDAGAVRRIEVQVPRMYLRVCNIQEPVTGLQGKFSLRAVAAMAMLGDDTTDIHAYSAKRMAHPELVDMRDRVQVHPRDELRYASVTVIETTDGRRPAVSSDERPKSRNPATQGPAVVKKFHTLVEPVLGKERAAELRERVLELERLASVQPLIALSLRRESVRETAS